MPHHHHHHLVSPLSPILSNDDRNSHAPAAQRSHFNVSLPYPLALSSGFALPKPTPAISPSSDLQHPQWLPGRGTELQQRKGGGGGGEWVGMFIVPFLSPLSVFIYDMPSMTGAVERPQGECGAHGTLVTVT